MTRHIVTHALKMVTPMRREFNLDIDVERVLKDEKYANLVHETTQRSQSTQLRAQGMVLIGWLRGLWGSDCSPDHQAATDDRRR